MTIVRAPGEPLAASIAAATASAFSSVTQQIVEPEPERVQEKPPAPEPAQAARPKAGELVQEGAGVAPPQLVSFPKPEYPPMARNLRVEGIVVVAVLVDENGQVQDARVEESVRQKVGLNEAALKSARAARYKPATKDGVKVKMWTRLRVPFKL